MYILTKMSKPGFDLKTESIGIVRDILENGICSMCTLKKEDSVEYEGLTVNKSYYNQLIDDTNKLYEEQDGYKTISKKNKEKLKEVDLAMVYELLNTSCGAEYWFEHERDESSDEILSSSKKN